MSLAPVDFDAVFEKGTLPSHLIERLSNLKNLRTRVGRKHPMLESQGSTSRNAIATEFIKDEGTIDHTSDADLLRLRIAYQQVISDQYPNSIFVEAVNTIEWMMKPAAFYEEAVDMALTLDAVAVARQLAKLGHDLYPDSPKLARFVNVLALPQKLNVDRLPKQGLSLAIQWMRHHTEEYRQQWVVIRNGELIASSISRDELVNTLGGELDAANVVVIWIP